MHFRELTEQDQQSYHAFVAYHPQGSFLQSWEWGNWQTTLGRQTHRFTIEDATSNEILLSAQVLLTPAPYISKPYLYIPYGPLLNKDLHTSRQQEALMLFLSEVNERFPGNIFIRVEPCQALPTLLERGTKTKNIQPARTVVLDLNKNEDELLKNMHTKTRYNIKVAQRHEIEVHSELVAKPGSGLSLEETVKLIVTTSSRQNYKNHSSNYFKNLIDFFGLQTEPRNLELSIYQAFFKNQLLASALMVDYGRTRAYLFGGTSNEYKNVMAPYAMHWQAIRDAQTHGLECYDFYGIETAGGTTPGFVRFKLGFGGNEIEYPGAYDIIHQPGWYTIYKVLRAAGRLLRR